MYAYAIQSPLPNLDRFVSKPAQFKQNSEGQPWIGIHPELSGRISVHFNGNSFAKFGRNASRRPRSFLRKNTCIAHELSQFKKYHLKKNRFELSGVHRQTKLLAACPWRWPPTVCSAWVVLLMLSGKKILVAQRTKSFLVVECLYHHKTNQKYIARQCLLVQKSTLDCHMFSKSTFLSGKKHRFLFDVFEQDIFSWNSFHQSFWSVLKMALTDPESWPLPWHDDDGRVPLPQSFSHRDFNESVPEEDIGSLFCFRQTNGGLKILEREFWMKCPFSCCSQGFRWKIRNFEFWVLRRNVHVANR